MTIHLSIQRSIHSRSIHGLRRLFTIYAGRLLKRTEVGIDQALDRIVELFAQNDQLVGLPVLLQEIAVHLEDDDHQQAEQDEHQNRTDQRGAEYVAEVSQFGRLLVRLLLAIVFIGGRLLSNQLATSGRVGALLKQMVGRFELRLQL